MIVLVMPVGIYFNCFYVILTFCVNIILYGDIATSAQTIPINPYYYRRYRYTTTHTAAHRGGRVAQRLNAGSREG